MIERKIVFELLRCTETVGTLREHKYLGLGSIWFVDFLYAHRHLGIESLVSMEVPEHHERAAFNRPYDAIQVVSGLTHDLLPEMDATEWLTPAVVWLDYDGVLDDQVASDLRVCLSNLAPGSILIATVNANRRFYRSEAHAQSSVDAVANALAGDYIDPDFVTTEGALPDVSNAQFPLAVADAMQTFLSGQTSAMAREDGGELIEFVPLINSFHQDGADMVTVGGVVTKSGLAGDYRTSVAHLVEFSGSRPVQFRLDLLSLTNKEKMTLDSLLPAADPVAFAASGAALGLRLDVDQYAKYLKLYRYFPVYAEAVL